MSTATGWVVVSVWIVPPELPKRELYKFFLKKEKALKWAQKEKNSGAQSVELVEKLYTFPDEE